MRARVRWRVASILPRHLHHRKWIVLLSRVLRAVVRGEIGGEVAELERRRMSPLLDLGALLFPLRNQTFDLLIESHRLNVVEVPAPHAAELLERRPDSLAELAQQSATPVTVARPGASCARPRRRDQRVAEGIIERLGVVDLALFEQIHHFTRPVAQAHLGIRQVVEAAGERVECVRSEQPLQVREASRTRWIVGNTSVRLKPAARHLESKVERARVLAGELDQQRCDTCTVGLVEHREQL
mmetsp:Transcript_37085/g.108657  ORF Transcript_37085/g.108657 Transcript_37085/m.108657 type:complete len:241 (-) Transcript_37085:3261-3983(-)